MDFYCNPIKKQGDFADPFVLRHNGKYYLYATNPDIRCWSSNDLVSWIPEGPAIAPETFPGLVPFAPEVVYWNGAFYMYTSPHGRGHYVLKSDTPTGPFRKITNNIGHSIDGSVFIDDDGKWYFYWADESGILGCEMRSPTEFGPPVQTGAFLHGWTEGPMIVKQDDTYYMNYTGNHYLSRGYRIHAASSKHPLTGYTDCPNNPIIVHTNGAWTGLGHSSTVYGPDMLTRYIVYHNINEDLTRDLNIDALLLGECVRVAGPSTLPQPVPTLPEFSDHMSSGDNWTVLEGSWSAQEYLHVTSVVFRSRCKRTLTASKGVIEFNFCVGEGEGTYSVDVGSLMIMLETGSNIVKLFDQRNKNTFSYDTPYVHDHRALHCLQIRYQKDGLKLFLDGKYAGSYPVEVCAGESIGYRSNGPSIGIGYTAFHGGDEKSAAGRLFFPTPCSIPLDGRSNIVVHLNLAEAGEYLFALTCSSVQLSNAELTYVTDDNAASAHLLAASCDTAVYTLSLPCGLHEIRAELGEGLCNPGLLTICPLEQSERVREVIDCFAANDKRCWGNIRGPACETTLELGDNLTSDEASVGILFCASELSYGGEGQDRELGKNFFIGYCVSFGHGQLVLTKHRYDETELASIAVENEVTIDHLRVNLLVNDIEVYINGGSTPLLSYHDPEPILFGRTGIRTKTGGLIHAVFQSADVTNAEFNGGQHDQPLQK